MDIRGAKKVITPILVTCFLILAFITEDQIYSHLFWSLTIIFGLLSISNIGNPKRTN
jgi:succinate-acetate transporter protein